MMTHHSHRLGQPLVVGGECKGHGHSWGQVSIRWTRGRQEVESLRLTEERGIGNASGVEKHFAKENESSGSFLTDTSHRPLPNKISESMPPPNNLCLHHRVSTLLCYLPLPAGLTIKICFDTDQEDIKSIIDCFPLWSSSEPHLPPAQDIRATTRSWE